MTMRHIIGMRRVVLFTKFRSNRNEHLLFSDCTDLYVKNCSTEFITNNITNWHFPKVKNISVFDGRNELDKDQIDNLAKKLNWQIGDYGTHDKYRFHVGAKLWNIDVDRILYGILK
jgi:hypothetical protein